MNEEEIRMECLRLATAQSRFDGSDTLKVAQDYYAFVVAIEPKPEPLKAAA